VSKTAIEWTDCSLNPIRARHIATGKTGHHCVKVSPGCANCYASRMQSRFGLPPFRAGAEGLSLSFDNRPLFEALRRRTPTRYFLCDMTDLFGDWVPDAWIDRCFAVMALAPRHTFQVLTKRPERMRQYFASKRAMEQALQPYTAGGTFQPVARPLANVWLGVSVENQATANVRVPLLLQTPAAVRFVSCEPLLGPVDLTTVDTTSDSDPGYSALELRDDDEGDLDSTLDWVIVGGESGPNARVCDIGWIRGLVQQCQEAGTAVFVKQLGSKTTWLDDLPFGMKSRKGSDPAEWPEDLRIREFPA
jgi:protein gp37